MISSIAKNTVDEFGSMENRLNKSVDKNNELIKTLATIRQKLERAVKNPDTILDEVYDSINLCRQKLPNGADWKIDPSLTR
jgi:ABC-type transporter Mla subunit MlaD